MAKLWAFELLANGVVVVNDDAKEKILNRIRFAASAGQIQVLEFTDHTGCNFGMTTDSIVNWYDDAEAIDEIIKGQSRTE